MKSELFWRILKRMARTKFTINASINLSAIPRDKIINGKNGAKYLDVTLLVFTEKNQHGKDVAVALKRPYGSDEETVWLGGGWFNDIEAKKALKSDAPSGGGVQVVSDDELPF